MASPVTASRRATLLAVLAVGLLLRLAPVPFHGFQAQRVTTLDSIGYLQLADGLLHAHRFARWTDGSAGEPELFRTPGYPALVAAVKKLSPRPLPLLLLLQIACGVSAVAATFLLAERVASPRAAPVAAALVAVAVPDNVYANLVMADVATAASVAGAFALAARSSPGAGRALASGLLLTAATALRPVVVLLWVPLLLLLSHRGARRRGAVLFLVAALSFPVLWTLRNGVVAGRWKLSTAFDRNLELVLAPKVLARARGTTLAAAQSELAGHVVSTNPRRLALEVIARHPGATARELLGSTAEMLLAGERRNLLRLFGSEGRHDGAASIGEGDRRAAGVVAGLARHSTAEQALVVSQIAWNAFVLTLAVIGTRRLWMAGRHVELAVLLLGLAVVLVPSLVVATGRMRIPVSCLLATLAGAAFAGRPAPPRGAVGGGTGVAAAQGSDGGE